MIYEGHPGAVSAWSAKNKNAASGERPDLAARVGPVPPPGETPVRSAWRSRQPLLIPARKTAVRGWLKRRSRANVPRSTDHAPPRGIEIGYGEIDGQSLGPPPEGCTAGPWVSSGALGFGIGRTRRAISHRLALNQCLHRSDGQVCALCRKQVGHRSVLEDEGEIGQGFSRHGDSGAPAISPVLLLARSTVKLNYAAPECGAPINLQLHGQN